MEAIAAIDQRLSEIQARIASFAPRSTPSAGAISGLSVGTLASSTPLYPEGTSFADVFGSIAQTTGTSLATAASQLNAKGVPTTLAGYGNGRIPESALAPLTGSSERMWAPAAQHLNDLLADAKKAGVSISITDAYRSYDDQVAHRQTKGPLLPGRTRGRARHQRARLGPRGRPRARRQLSSMDASARQGVWLRRERAARAVALAIRSHLVDERGPPPHGPRQPTISTRPPRRCGPRRNPGWSRSRRSCSRAPSVHLATSAGSVSRGA